jgi:hypothetical protein
LGLHVNTTTESADDLLLRESLCIVREANKTKLFALAAIYLVHNPPESLMPTEHLLLWWDSVYFPLLQQFVAEGWTREDLGYLERLGAIERDQAAEALLLRVESRPGPPINNALSKRGLGYADTFGSSARKQSNFAIYCSRLHYGSAKTTTWPAAGFPLIPYSLTAPGRRVAITMIDSLTEGTIEQGRSATTYPFRTSENELQQRGR